MKKDYYGVRADIEQERIDEARRSMHEQGICVQPCPYCREAREDAEHLDTDVGMNRMRRKAEQR